MDRVLLLKLAAVAVFLILLTGLVQAQIFAGDYYRHLAQGNRLQEVSLPSPRGIIFDRNGVALTANIPVFQFNGQEISKDQAIVLESQGKIPQISTQRTYLFGSLLEPVLGYVDADRVGQSGVEQNYDNILRGVDGKELAEVDATGQKLRVLSTVPPTPGQNLTLTVDINLQKAATEALGNKKGAVIVSNPATGEILVLVSGPSFDPNRVSDYLNSPDQPLFNRAISGTYPPGSTFKIVTATAGLETGVIKSTTLIEDTGVLVVGSYQFPNWKWLRGGGTDGWINVVTAIRNSNDLFFYKVGEMTGMDNLLLWAGKFGLGQPLGIDLPGEAGGNITKKQDWYLGDTYHWAIGQGDLLVTPLQDNFWTNVIANGGKLCRPHVLKTEDGKQKTDCREAGIKQNTIDLVKEGMTQACQPGGTGYPLFDFKPQVACKTGTAEFGTENKTHAWFTAFVDNISVTVLVEGGGEGSDVAAPIARKVLAEYFGK